MSKTNKITGALILGFIAAIFGTDSILALGNHLTISEWFSNWLHSDPALGFTVLIGSFIMLIAHFWWFRPNKDN